MPQTEHLMVGIQSAPPSPQMLRLQIDGLASGQNSPALSHKSYFTGKHHYTAVPQRPNGTKQYTKPQTKKPAIPEKQQPPEKRDHFSMKWELQLSALVLVCFFVGLVVPLSMIIVGSVYVFDCPQEVMIPVFLIVFGATFLATVFGLRKLRSNKLTQVDEASSRSIFWTIVLFQIGWFAVGCYWVYQLREPNYNADSEEPYCNKTLYQYAFWLLNSVFIVIGVAGIGFLIFIFCSISKTPNSPTITITNSV